MPSYLGLTWDHPRGLNALAAAAAGASTQGLQITWAVQPLEGFESHPLSDLSQRYDLLVLDHPHVGEAVSNGALQPLEGLFTSEELGEVGRNTIGPCFESYRYAERHWALPLDAATQVMAFRPDLLDATPPRTWDEVARLSARCGKVALCLAGPHAFLSLLSIAAALAETGTQHDPDQLFAAEVGTASVAMMIELAARTPRHTIAMNPIALLGQMAAGSDVVLCPLVYGYVNYAAPGAGRKALRFVDAPRRIQGSRPGSTLGGTGIGISRRCAISPALLDHLRWLMSAPAQDRFIPAHEGQPSRRSAWSDPELNARWGCFYSNTAATLEAAYVRPRYAGYIAFQTAASAYLRAGLQERRPAAALASGLLDMHRRSLAAAGPAERAHA